MPTRAFSRDASPLAALDVDGDGTPAPLTDGLLVLRFFFGFTGPTVIEWSPSAVCTRRNPTTIQLSYSATAGLVLDIDGNGATEPLTDGLLALRFLFGFSGSSLVRGAVDSAAVPVAAPRRSKPISRDAQREGGSVSPSTNQ